MRQATNVDLQAYAKAAAKQGRLDSRHLYQLEQQLSEEGLQRSRNNALIEWIDPDAGRAAGKKANRNERRVARPYTHPYFWAGFIYTGL